MSLARSLGCLAGLLAIAVPAAVRAEAPASRAADPAAPSDPAAMARAKALFERGVAAYGAARYHEAIEIFQETRRVYPNPQLAYNIARAYDHLGSKSAALRYFREYLRGTPSASDRDAVAARVRELEEALAERGIQQLSVLSEPNDVTVLLDGHPVGLTPWTGETWPGRHRVTLERAGYQPAELFVDVELLSAAEVSAHLVPARPACESSARAPSRSEAETQASPGVLTWVTLGLGTAALGAAIAVESAVDSRARVHPATAFLAGVGAAGATVGGVMLYLDLERPAPAPAQSGRFYGVGYSGRF